MIKFLPMEGGQKPRWALLDPASNPSLSPTPLPPYPQWTVIRARNMNSPHPIHPLKYLQLVTTVIPMKKYTPCAQEGSVRCSEVTRTANTRTQIVKIITDGDPGSVPGSGGSPGEGNGNSLQYSCPRNPLDRGAWWATVHGVAKESDTI